MQRRRLGSTDREICVVGLGGKGLTGARRGIEPADVQRAVAAAIEGGCELVDLSCPGGGADAERKVGEELRALRARDRVVVATAVVSGAPRRPPPAAQVVRTVEDSLRALRLDAIPLVQLAPWDDAWLDDRTWPELRGALARLVSEGKVLAWGAVIPDRERRPAPAPPPRPTSSLIILPDAPPPPPAPPLRVLAEPWLATIQLRYSLFDRGDEDALLPAAAAAKVGVIAREPLAGGGLAGDLGPGTAFAPGDERAAWPAARWHALPPEHARLAAYVTTTPPVATATEAGKAIVDELRRGPDLEQATVAELALRAALAHPAITAVIPGARTPAHAAANLACADGRPVPPRVLDALRARRWCPAWYGVES